MVISRPLATELEDRGHRASRVDAPDPGLAEASPVPSSHGSAVATSCYGSASTRTPTSIEERPFQ
jgi:hypothetical protein